MKHIRNISTARSLPFRAASLLVKQAQLDVAGNAVELLGNISSLVKEWTGQDNSGEDNVRHR